MPPDTSCDPPAIQPPPKVKTKAAPYAINRDKVVNRLAAAASSSMEDFNIDVKDSSGNVNLKCSPAFYAAVAKPALEALPPDWSSDPVAGCIATSPAGPTVLQDVTNIHQNSQLKMNISTHSPTPTLLGTIAKNLIPVLCSKQGCGKFFHKVDQPLHICIPVARSPSTVLQKRQQAPDTSVQNTPSYRDARPEIDIDSDADSEVDFTEPQSSPTQSVNMVALRPSTLAPLSSLPPTGQELLQEAVASLQVPQQALASLQVPQQAVASLQAPQQGDQQVAPTPINEAGVLQQSLSLQPPLAPLQVVQQAVRPKNSRARPAAPQLTAQGLQVELLNREITMAKTKVTELDTTVADLEAANKILIERICLFEQRTNDTNFAEYFPQQNTPSAPPPPPVPCPVIPQPPLSHTPPCCSNSSKLLLEVEIVKAQLEDLSGAVALLLRAVPHPLQPPMECPPSHQPPGLARGHQGSQGAPSSSPPHSAQALPTGSQAAQGSLNTAPFRPAPRVASGSAAAPAPSGYLADLLLLDTPDSAEFIASSAHFPGEPEAQLSSRQPPQPNGRDRRRARPASRQPLHPGPTQHPSTAPPPPRIRRALLPTPPGWGADFYRSQNLPQHQLQANPSLFPPSGRPRNTGANRTKAYRPAPPKSVQPTEGILIDLNF